MIAFQSNGYSALPRDEERLAVLERSKEETRSRGVEAHRCRRAEKASEDRAEGRAGA